MSVDKLVLFDIDQTLLEVSQSHILSFSLAFKKVFGVDAGIEVVAHQGMTDQQIVVDVLKMKGFDEKMIMSKMGECMSSMAEFFNELVLDEEIKVLAGVKELLCELDKRDVLMGLVTGNLEPIARSKLERVGLSHYFKVGGFGSDDINRANLVRIAIRRAEEMGFRFDDNVILFGDSMHDIKAGCEGGVKTVGVACGVYSEEELRNAGADAVLDDLCDIGKILKIIF